MNRQTLTIAAGLLAAVLVVFGIAVYLQRGGPDDGPAPITGPGRAAEARGIIADIEQRRSRDDDAAPAEPAVDLLGDDDNAGQPAAGGAIAVTPAPPPAAPAGATAELDEAFEQAMQLQAEGKLDDAQVLLFFGARRGHARSAFAYAELNDPNHHSPETSLLAEPDAFQAYRWYTAALDAGMAAAGERLAALRAWTEKEAAAGNTEADQLLLQWE